MPATHLHLLKSVAKKVPASQREAVSDQELLHRYTQDHDDSAFEALVKRYGGLVLGTARRIVGHHQTAEDVLQATFLVLARKARSIPWKQTIAPWLYATAYRLASKARQRRIQVDCRRKPHAALPEDKLQWAETCQAMDSELMRLADSTRAALILCYLEGKTRDEAAELLGLSLATLKRRLEQGRHLMRDRLTRRGITLSTASVGLMLAQTQLEAASLQAVINAMKSQTPRAAVAGLVSGGILLSWMSAAAVVLGIGLAGIAYWYSVSAAAEAVEMSEVAIPVISPRNDPAQIVDAVGDPLPAGAIRRFGTVRWRPGQMMVALSYSTDQKHVVGWLKGCSRPQGTDRLVYWDRATGKEAVSLEMPRNDLLSMRWLTDGKLLALTRFTHRNYHLCAFTQGLETRFPEVDGSRLNTIATGDIGSADISPDGQWIITGKLSLESSIQPIELWPASPNASLSNPITLGSYGGHGMYVQFSGDGKKAVAICRKQGKSIEVPSERMIGQPVTSPVIPGSWEEQATVLIFDIASKKQLTSFKINPPLSFAGDFSPPHRMAMNHDGTKLYFNDEEGTVQGYDTETGQSVFQWNIELPANKQKNNNRRLVTCVYLSPQDKWLYTANDQGAIRTWDLAKQAEGPTFRLKADSFSHLAFTQDGQQLAAASSSITTEIALLNTTTGERENALRGHPSYVTDIALQPNGKMKTLSLHHDMVTWDLRTGKELSCQQIPMGGGYKGMLSFTRDQKGIFGFLPDSYQLGYLDLDTDRVLPCVPAAKGHALKQFLGTTGSGIFFLDEQRKLSYWDAITKSLQKTYSIEIPRLQSTPEYAQFSPDQLTLAVVSSGTLSANNKGRYRCGALSLHDAKTGKLVKYWLSPMHELLHVSYTADGKNLLVHGMTLGQTIVPETPADLKLALDKDATQALLDATTGQVVQVYDRPNQTSWIPCAICWHDDGHTLAVAYGDSSIAIYDRNAAQPRQVFHGHRGEISCLRFHQNQLLSASDDGTCLLWDVKP